MRLVQHIKNFAKNIQFVKYDRIAMRCCDLKKTLTMMANNIGRGQCYCDCLNPKLGVCGARNKKGHSMI